MGKCCGVGIRGLRWSQREGGGCCCGLAVVGEAELVVGGEECHRGLPIFGYWGQLFEFSNGHLFQSCKSQFLKAKSIYKLLKYRRDCLFFLADNHFDTFHCLEKKGIFQYIFPITL